MRYQVCSFQLNFSNGSAFLFFSPPCKNRVRSSAEKDTPVLQSIILLTFDCN